MRNPRRTRRSETAGGSLARVQDLTRLHVIPAVRETAAGDQEALARVAHFLLVKSLFHQSRSGGTRDRGNLSQVSQFPPVLPYGLAPSPGHYPFHRHGRRMEELLEMRARQPDRLPLTRKTPLHPSGPVCSRDGHDGGRVPEVRVMHGTRVTRVACMLPQPFR